MVSPSIGKNTSVEQWLSNSGLSQINNLFVFREGAFHAWPESLATEHELPLLNFIEPGNALFLSLPSATIRTHDLRAVSRQNIAITTPGWHLVSPLIREPISPAQIIAQGIASNHPFTAIDRIFAYQDGAWKRFITARQNEADLLELRPGQGFWIYAKEVDGKTISPQNPLLLKPVGEIQKNRLLSLWVEDRDGETFFHASMESKANQNLTFHLSAREPDGIPNTEFVPIHSFPLLTLEENPKVPGLLGGLSSQEAGVIQSSWLWDTGRDFVGTEPGLMELLLEVKTDAESVDLASFTTVVPNPGVVMRMPYLIPPGTRAPAFTSWNESLLIHGGFLELSPGFSVMAKQDQIMQYDPIQHKLSFLAHGGLLANHSMISDAEGIFILGEDSETFSPANRFQKFIPHPDGIQGEWVGITRPQISQYPNSPDLNTFSYIHNGRLFLFSSSFFHDGSFKNVIQAYDPDSDSWSLSTPLEETLLYKTGGALCEGVLLYAGSSTNANFLNPEDMYADSQRKILMLEPETGTVLNSIPIPQNAWSVFSISKTAISCINQKAVLTGGIIEKDTVVEVDLQNQSTRVFAFPNHLSRGTDASYLHTTIPLTQQSRIYMLRNEGQWEFKGSGIDVVQIGPAKPTAAFIDSEHHLSAQINKSRLSISHTPTTSSIYTLSKSTNEPFLLVEDDAIIPLQSGSGLHNLEIDPTYILSFNSDTIVLRHLLSNGPQLASLSVSKIETPWNSELLAIPLSLSTGIGKADNGANVYSDSVRKTIYRIGSALDSLVPGKPILDHTLQVLTWNPQSFPEILQEYIPLSVSTISESPFYTQITADSEFLYLTGGGRDLNQSNYQRAFRALSLSSLDQQKKLPYLPIQAPNHKAVIASGFLHVFSPVPNQPSQIYWQKYDLIKNIWLSPRTMNLSSSYLHNVFAHSGNIVFWHSKGNEGSSSSRDVPMNVTTLNLESNSLQTYTGPLELWAPDATVCVLDNKAYTPGFRKGLPGILELNLTNFRQRFLRLHNLKGYSLNSSLAILCDPDAFIISMEPNNQPSTPFRSAIYKVPRGQIEGIMPVSSDYFYDNSGVSIYFTANHVLDLEAISVEVSQHGIQYDAVQIYSLTYNEHSKKYTLTIKAEDLPYSADSGFVRIKDSSNRLIMETGSIKLKGLEPSRPVCETPVVSPANGSTLMGYNLPIQIGGLAQTAEVSVYSNGKRYSLSLDGTQFVGTIPLEYSQTWPGSQIALAWDGCSTKLNYSITPDSAPDVQLLKVSNQRFSPMGPSLGYPRILVRVNAAISDVLLTASSLTDGRVCESASFTRFNANQSIGTKVCSGVNCISGPGDYTIILWDGSCDAQNPYSAMGEWNIKASFRAVGNTETVELDVPVKVLY